MADRLVVQRLDQLQSSGLCERLTDEWSRTDRQPIARAQFDRVGGALAGFLTPAALKLACDEPPRFHRADLRRGERACVVVACVEQRSLDFVAEHELGEFFPGSLSLDEQAAVIVAVLQPDEERDQAWQSRVVEQVLALDSGERARRATARYVTPRP